jgi:hypothetical protein
MKALLTPALAASLLLGGATLALCQGDSRTAAQNSREEKENSKIVTNNGTTKIAADTVYGKVESYEPGKSIKVSVPGTILTSKAFDLSGSHTTASVASGVKVGDWVRVQEKTDNSGHKNVSVAHSSEKRANQSNKS